MSHVHHKIIHDESFYLSLVFAKRHYFMRYLRKIYQVANIYVNLVDCADFFKRTLSELLCNEVSVYRSMRLNGIISTLITIIIVVARPRWWINMDEYAIAIG